MGVSAYGLVLCYRPPLASGDLRFWPTGGSSAYTVFNDTAFDDDYCHRFNGIADSHNMRLWFHRDAAVADADYPIDLAVDDRLVVGFEVSPEASIQGGTGEPPSPADPWFPILHITGGEGVIALQFRHINSGNERQMRIVVTDNNGTSTTSSTYTYAASANLYRKVEIEVERTATSTLVVNMNVLNPSRTQVITVSHTVTGADKDWKFKYVLIGHGLGDSNKADTYDVRFGRFLGSWSDGTIDTDDKQNPWYDSVADDGWGPNWLAAFPTSDVTNEWTAGDFADVDDPFGSYDENVAVGDETAQLTSGQTRARFLLGWDDESVLDGENVQAVVVHSQTRGETTRDNEWMAYLSSRSGTEDVTGAFTPTGSTTKETNDHGIFRFTPQDTRWTELKVNASDFGIERPAVGSNKEGFVVAIWRDILYGGHVIEDAPEEDGTMYTQSVAGNFTFTGTVTKQTQRTLAGNFTFTGAVTTATSYLRTLAGNFGFTGAVVKQTRRTLAGTCGGLLGNLTKQTRRTLAGEFTFTGAVTTAATFLRTLAGDFTFNGDLTRAFIAGAGNGSNIIIRWWRRHG